MSSDARRQGIRILLMGLAAFILALAVTAAVKMWPVIYPELVETAVLDPNCDLRQGPCTSQLPSGGSIGFGIEPRSIPLLKRLRLQVRTAGVNALSVQVDFSGVDMNMGYNRFALSREADGLFTGEAVLPVCVRQWMRWKATVMVSTPAGIVAAPFLFDTVAP